MPLPFSSGWKNLREITQGRRSSGEAPDRLTSRMQVDCHRCSFDNYLVLSFRAIWRKGSGLLLARPEPIATAACKSLISRLATRWRLPASFRTGYAVAERTPHNAETLRQIILKVTTWSKLSSCWGTRRFRRRSAIWVQSKK